MSLDKEIVEDFVAESKSLVSDLVDLLESVEGNPSVARRLADYGNSVDRIMGGAQSLALLAPPEHALHMIADYTGLCKMVGYKTSQISGNDQFFDICVAFLIDATETLQTLLQQMNQPVSVLKSSIPEAFIERLRWISQQFDGSYTMSVDAGFDINQLLKKLGI